MTNVSPLRIVNHLLSPGGPRARLTIMIYHRVPQTADSLLPDEPDAVRFEQTMRRLRCWFNVVPLESAAMRLKARTLPPRALSITFDDGYADNHDVALPILQRLGLHATFFVATGFLDGGCMWNDKVIEAVRACPSKLDLREIGLGEWQTTSLADKKRTVDTLLPRLKYLPAAKREEAADCTVRQAGARMPTSLMMTSSQVRALATAGMAVGAHTEHHPILANLRSQDAMGEIASSKARLEALLDRAVTLFAYPNGKPMTDYTPENVEQVRALGFVAACSTAAGAASTDCDLMQLPRFTPWDREAWKFGVRLAGNLRTRPNNIVMSRPVEYRTP